MTHRYTIACTALFLTVCLAASDAEAYRITKCWNGTKMNWAQDHKRFDADADAWPPGAPHTVALQSAFDRINEVPADISASLYLDPDELVGAANAENEVYFVADLDAPAECWRTHDVVLTCYIIEADIRLDKTRFNQGKFTGSDQTADSFAYTSGAKRQLEPIFVHEIGHCIGLGHEDREYNIMGTDWDHVHANGPTIHSYAGVDATDALRVLYGSKNKGENLAAVHWTYEGSTNPGCDGDNSCYSKHKQVGLQKAPDDGIFTGGSLVKNGVTNFDAWYVVRGQKVRIDLGYENLGASAQTVEIELFHSEDALITTDDTALNFAPVTMSLPSSSLQYRTDDVIVPANAANDTSYLGAVIDAADDVDEINEADNGTFVPIVVLAPTAPKDLGQSINFGGTLQMALDPANGSIDIPTIDLTATVGAYPADYDVGDCRVNVYVQPSSAPPSSAPLTSPTASSAFVAPGSGVIVAVGPLPAGEYRWYAMTQCENESIGFGSELTWVDTTGPHFRVLGPQYEDVAAAPVGPFNLRTSMFPVDDPTNTDHVEVLLRADAFDLNGDAVRFAFLAVRVKHLDGASAPLKFYGFATELAYPTSPFAGQTVTGAFQFLGEAGVYNWIAVACDATDSCSEIATGEQFEVDPATVNGKCNPSMRYCNVDGPGFYRVPGLVNWPIPPIDPFVLPLDLLSQTTQPAALTGRLVNTRRGLLPVGVEVVEMDLQTLTPSKLQLQPYAAFEQHLAGSGLR